MAVYAVPNNRPIRSNKPLKWKRKRTPLEMQINEFLETHNVDFHIDEETGEGTMHAVEKDKETCIDG